MEANEKTEQRRVVVDVPGVRKEIVTETIERGPEARGISATTVAIITILVVMVVGVILYGVNNRNANEAANRNANLDAAATQAANEHPPTTIVQQPASQAPVIIQQPAQSAPVIVQQPAVTNTRDNASDDANMQEVSAKRLSDDPEMTAVSITISGAQAVLTGSVKSEAAKAKAERLVMAVRGMKSVENKIVVFTG